MIPTESLIDIVEKVGSIQLTVCGESMLPTILPGEVVHVDRYPLEHVAVGDIVAFSKQGVVTIHRAVSRRGIGLYTCGDNNTLLDELIDDSSYIGRVRRTKNRIDVDRRPVEDRKDREPIYLYTEDRISLDAYNPIFLKLRPISKQPWHLPPNTIIGLSPGGIYDETSLVNWVANDPNVVLSFASFGSTGKPFVPVEKVKGVVKLKILESHSIHENADLILAYIDGLLSGALL